MKAYSFLVVGLMLFVSCNQNSESKANPVISIDSPAGSSSALPSLFSNGEQTLLSWVESVNDSTSVLKYAQLLDGDWQEPQEIIRGVDWFVNWADFPTIAENNGHLISHILKKSSPETFSYDIKMNMFSSKSGQWKTNLELHSDSTQTEHGFVTLLPYKNDSFFATWLDGRNTAGSGHGHHSGAMTIRAAEVNLNGVVHNEYSLDERTCDCCQTSAAITNNGPVVVYRDRSSDEVRDMSIVRMVYGKWTEPKPVYKDNWQIKGCPVNGPKAAALGNNLVVAWFTEANNEAKVKVAFSADGGAQFDLPIRIGTEKVLGRVDIVIIDANSAIVSWMESTEKQAQFKAIKVHKSGNVGKSIVITEMDNSRKSGFPQMELVGQNLYFAWTHINDNSELIKTAKVSLESF